MEMMVNGMKREGLSQADIDLMMKKNPAKFLGLES
jgi:predicted metal-dependent phosphotriesterase family hydrolase